MIHGSHPRLIQEFCLHTAVEKTNPASERQCMGFSDVLQGVKSKRGFVDSCSNIFVCGTNSAESAR